MIGTLLFELLGKMTLTDSYEDMRYATYKNDDFIVFVQENNGTYLVSIDLIECFNKEWQMPIHFICHSEDISKRRKNRIKSAINYLLTHRKDAGSFFGQMDGYDDLGEWVRSEFYKN